MKDCMVILFLQLFFLFVSCRAATKFSASMERSLISISIYRIFRMFHFPRGFKGCYSPHNLKVYPWGPWMVLQSINLVGLYLLGPYPDVYWPLIRRRGSPSGKWPRHEVYTTHIVDVDRLDWYLLIQVYKATSVISLIWGRCQLCYIGSQSLWKRIFLNFLLKIEEEWSDCATHWLETCSAQTFRIEWWAHFGCMIAVG